MPTRNNEEYVMPLIEVKLIEGVFSQEQKQQMITKLTDAMVSIEGENMRGVTVVLVEEVKSGDWGIGGKPMSTADAKALAARKATGQTREEPAEQPQLVGPSGRGRMR
jgi:4-oxalocrotonate tautomerase